MSSVLLLRIKRKAPKLLRFGFVGVLGATINLGAYYIATTVLQWGVNLSAVCAFVVAVSNNYVLNHLWTFGAENQNNRVNFRQYVYYGLGNVFGLLVNLIVLNLIITFLGIKFHLAGQALGILCGMSLNFVIAKKFVFIAERSSNELTQAMPIAEL
jgi:putative flippase GtrA